MSLEQIEWLLRNTMSATATDTIELTSPPAALLTTKNLTDSNDDPISHNEALSRPEQPALQKGTTVIIFASITGVTGISSLLSGLVTIVLPIMARDLNLSPSVLLWYLHLVLYCLNNKLT